MTTIYFLHSSQIRQPKCIQKKIALKEHNNKRRSVFSQSAYTENTEDKNCLFNNKQKPTKKKKKMKKKLYMHKMKIMCNV